MFPLPVSELELDAELLAEPVSDSDGDQDLLRRCILREPVFELGLPFLPRALREGERAGRFPLRERFLWDLERRDELPLAEAVVDVDEVDEADEVEEEVARRDIVRLGPCTVGHGRFGA